MYACLRLLHLAFVTHLAMFSGSCSIKRSSSHKNKHLMKMFLSTGHPRCRWVCFYTQIWRNLALHHLLTNGSSAVNGCRQNEGIFNLKPLLLAKIRIHNNASSSEKCPSAVFLSHQNPLTNLFWTVFTLKWCLICAYSYIFLLTLYLNDQFSLLLVLLSSKVQAFHSPRHTCCWWCDNKSDLDITSILAAIISSYKLHVNVLFFL